MEVRPALACTVEDPCTGRYSSYHLGVYIRLMHGYPLLGIPHKVAFMSVVAKLFLHQPDCMTRSGVDLAGQLGK